MLDNYLQQTNSPDVIFQMHFFGAIRVNFVSADNVKTALINPLVFVSTSAFVSTLS